MKYRLVLAMLELLLLLARERLNAAHEPSRLTATAPQAAHALTFIDFGDFTMPTPSRLTASAPQASHAVSRPTVAAGHAVTRPTPQAGHALTEAAPVAGHTPSRVT